MFRKPITVALLVAFGLPTLLGAGLHGPADCCGDSAHDNICVHDCPCDHTHDEAVPTGTSIGERHVCLLCSFLAMAKTACQIEVANEHRELVPPERVVIGRVLYVTELTSNHSARGPPALLA